jgi:pullulanase/glycogen debranching enzyme
MNRLGQLNSVEEWERVEGSPSPLGATWVESEQGWNFALFSRHATGVTRSLYGDADVVKPVFELKLDPVQQGLQAGRVNRDTIVPMCQVLEEALLEWQKELKRCSVLLGTIR